MNFIAPRKIVVIKFRSLGDTVILAAALHELRRALPNTEIHVAVTKPWIHILENHPAVTRLWPYERYDDTASRAKAIARMALKMRKEHFDWALNFHASPSSAMLAFSTGASTRAIHFHGHRDKNRYSTVDIPGKGKVKSIIERDMDVLRAVGIEIPEGKFPKIHLTHGELDEANNAYDRHGLTGAVLGLGLGASRPSKIWPIQKFADLAVNWCLKTQGSVFTVSAPGEEALASQFLDGVDKTLTAQSLAPADKKAIQSRIQVLHNLSVRQLGGMLYQCAGFVGNDSGPMHLAAALQTPTLTLMGPEHPYEWHPYPPERHPFLYIDDLKCRKDALPGFPAWCGVNTCIEEGQRCMVDIPASSALEKILGVARL